VIAPLQSLREWWSTIVASLGRWFRPPRHVLTLSLGVTGALSPTMGWLVWLLIALMINADSRTNSSHFSQRVRTRGVYNHIRLSRQF
jgi:hypothetical protein